MSRKKKTRKKFRTPRWISVNHRIQLNWNPWPRSSFLPTIVPSCSVSPAKMMTFLQLVIFLLNYLHHLNCGVRAAHFHVVQPAINIFRWNRHPSGNMMDSITWNQRNLRSNELRRDAHLVHTFGSALCGRSAVLWLIFLGNGLAAVALIKRLQRRPIKSDTGQRRKFLIRNGATIDRSLRCLQQEQIRKKVKHGAGWISEKNIQL